MKKVFDLKQLKTILPLLRLMQVLGFGDGKLTKLRCPFHNDQSLSLSVYQTDTGAQAWKCHTGCGGGDEISFVAKHFGLDPKEDYKRIVAPYAIIAEGLDGQTSGPPAVAAAVSPSIGQVPERPGITAATLQANGIRFLETKRELAPYGFTKPGIVIPYRNYPSLKPILDRGYIYARRRLPKPINKQKYDQNAGTTVHLYVPVGLPVLLARGWRILVIVEGEFKAISLVEAGIPAVGMSGFYGYRYGKKHPQAGKLVAELVAIFAHHDIKEVLFLGDNDTALNAQFSDALVEFVALVPSATVRAPRISLDMPKGIDDLRAHLNGTFQDVWEAIVRNAIQVTTQTTKVDLAETLLRKELDKIQAATGVVRDGFHRKLAKMAAYYRKPDRERFVLIAGELGLTEEEFMAMVRAEWEKQNEARENEKSANARKVFETLVASEPVSSIPVPPPTAGSSAVDSGPQSSGVTMAAPTSPEQTNIQAADDSAPKPFPLDALPPAFSRMAVELCRCIQVPPALPGCCMLGIMSAAIGKGLQVQSLPDRKTPANLYVLGSAASGTGKSITFNRVAEPFLTFERAYAEEWHAKTKPTLMVKQDLLEGTLAKRKKEFLKGELDGELLEKVQHELVALTAELEAIKRQMEQPALAVEDITTEKLGMMLSQNGECLTSLSADAGGIVNNLLGRYNKLERTDENLYLKAFSWDFAKVDRVGRESVRLEKPCLSLLWLVQPDKVDTLLKEPTLTDGGLLPRMMIAHTGCEPKEMPYDAPAINPEAANAYDAAIYTLIKEFRLREAPAIIRPEPEVGRFLIDYYNALVKRRRTDLRDVNSFAARWTEWAWRIAACLHAAAHLQDAPNHNLSLETAKSAVAIADWFSQQVLRILWAQRRESRRALLDKLAMVLADNPEGVSARDLQRAHIADRADEAAEILERLATEGFLVGRDYVPAGGGHKIRRYSASKVQRQ